MTKPVSTPRWANVGGDILEPNTGKKDIGFVGGERPPAQILNWLLNLIWQWVDYLSTGDHDHTTFIKNYPFHGTTHSRVGTHTTLVDGRVRTTVGMYEFGCPIPGLRIGDTLESVRFRVMDDNTDFITCGVRHIDADGVDTQLGTANSTVSGTVEWVVVDFADHVLIAGDRLMVTVKNGEPGGIPTGNMDVSMFEISYKRES